MWIEETTALIQNLHFRLERTSREVLRYKKAETRYPWLRFVTLLSGLLATYLAFQILPNIAGWVVGFTSLMIFVSVVLLHNRLIDRITRLVFFEELLAIQIARCDINWQHIPASSSPQVLPDHPFALDLAITGEKSIHQLLDTCISLGGSHLLAEWLTQTTPDPDETMKRQAVVKELAALPGFRTRVSLSGQLSNPNPAQRWDTRPLINWLVSRPRILSLRPFLIGLSILAVINIGLFLLQSFGIFPPYWIGSLAIYLGVQSLKFRETSEVFDESYSLGRQLGKLRNVLIEFETSHFKPKSMFEELFLPFQEQGRQPSVVLRNLTWIVSAASIRSNPFLGLFLNLLVPWDMFFAYRFEKFKATLRELLPVWANAWYEIEALSALANFARLHPRYSFPVLRPLNSHPVLETKALGHPLIPYQTRVSNDFQINNLGDLFIISGSNMSGKSTFLRTMGINLILAQAGSPVAALELQFIPFRVFTSMTINDSLNDGISFFYAEVRRLKRLLDQLEENQKYPLFFLIDEIFRGTNNRERELGSRAYTQALISRYGTGLVSTHDLSLVKLTGESTSIHNFHFKEDIQDDKMVFDYKIQPGASLTTNALRIMALAGLPISKESLPS